MRTEAEVRERLAELEAWRDSWVESAAATLRACAGLSNAAENAEAALSTAKRYDAELSGLRWVLEGEPSAKEKP